MDPYSSLFIILNSKNQTANPTSPEQSIRNPAANLETRSTTYQFPAWNAAVADRSP